MATNVIDLTAGPVDYLTVIQSMEKGQYSTASAKSEFFLTADDLQGLPYESGGWGSGQLRLYKGSTLKDVALTKYSVEEFMKKKMAKLARLNKKRTREEDAEKVAANLPAASASNVTIDKKAVAQTRSFLVKQCKKKVGANEFGSPNNFRIEVPNVSKELFAALINRPTDVDLKSIPKNGAYHSIRLNTTDLLGIAKVEDIKRDIGGTYACLDYSIEVKYKPAGMLLSVHCYSKHAGF